MKKALISGFIMLIMSMFSVYGQETKVKGLLLPFVEHSIGIEQNISEKFSIQMLYINRIDPSITKYYYHRLIPSVRYYILSNEKLRGCTYLEVFYRYAYTKQVSDQSPVQKFYSNSIGIDIGKQRLITDNLFIEGSIGYYYIISGEDPKNPLGTGLHNLRVDIKFGIRLKYNKK